MGRRILIADAYRDAAESLAQLLRFYQHEVTTAFTGSDALTLAAAFQPEIVFLSLSLPIINGYEVCRRMRNGEGGVAPRLLVALTGSGLEHERQASFAAGFHHHILKPADPNTILALLT